MLRYRPGTALFPNYDADDDDADDEEQEEEREKGGKGRLRAVHLRERKRRGLSKFPRCWEKLKASSLWAPFSPFRVQWQQKTFGAHERTNVATWIHYSL